MARQHSRVKLVDIMQGPRSKFMLVGLLSLAFTVATVLACEHAGAASWREWGPTHPNNLASSQAPIGSDILLLNYTAPSFTWLGPVSFHFTLLSNVSLNNTLYLSITSTDSIQSVFELHSLTPGLNYIEIETTLLSTAMPGDKAVNITFAHAGNTTSFIHVMWIGSGLVLAMAFLAGALIVAVAIIVKYGSTGTSASSASTTTSAGFSTGDDDTSTVTYVDQSRAPPGKIFCPECKKVIEEGSIFCPECGTRIPRYLRYKP